MTINSKLGFKAWRRKYKPEGALKRVLNAYLEYRGMGK